MKFPDQPELISIGDNVKITADVTFVNHDVFHCLFDKGEVPYYQGCIRIGNNVVIGTKVIILPNVKIGNNVVIGAGSVVSKDLDSNGVYAGVPAKLIGSFEEFMNKRKLLIERDFSYLWDEFK